MSTSSCIRSISYLNADFLRLPPGNYVIVIQVKFTATVLPPSGSVRLGMNLTMPPGAGLVVLDDSFTPQTTVTTVGAVYNVSATFNVTSLPRDDSAFNGIPMNLFGPALFDSAGPAYSNNTVSASNVMVANTYFQGAVPYTGSGPVEQLRPVSASLLVTFMGNRDLDGGLIAANYVPRDLVTSNFFANNTDAPGQMQFVESLMTTEDAYNGALRDGARVIWAPYDTVDYSMMTVAASNRHEWPSMIVSGTYQPPPGYAGNLNQVTWTLRCELVVVYEFVTKLTAFDQEAYLGSTALCDLCLQMLKSENFARSNGKHWAWLKAMSGKIWTFYKSNQSLINGLAGATISTLL